ncbi:MAG: hypothetical protein M1368_12655 [Thaumarchaeota archaeon]|nr:hypothetical protein [Nitrososphaerota archaeon]
MSHRSSVKLVTIYTWSEYHDRTEIEPHFDYTYNGSAYYLLNQTSNYVTKLNEVSS